MGILRRKNIDIDYSHNYSRYWLHFDIQTHKDGDRMTKPTPCEHEWILNTRTTKICSKCSTEIHRDDMQEKPTPEEKCEGIILTSNDVGDDGGYYAVYKTFSGWGKTAEDAYRELCVALSLVIEVQNEKHSPSPEARVEKVKCSNCGKPLSDCDKSCYYQEEEARVDWEKALLVGYKCEHIAKDEIGMDCVHCNLAVAEGSVQKLQEKVLRMQAVKENLEKREKFWKKKYFDKCEIIKELFEKGREAR